VPSVSTSSLLLWLFLSKIYLWMLRCKYSLQEVDFDIQRPATTIPSLFTVFPPFHTVFAWNLPFVATSHNLMSLGIGKNEICHFVFHFAYFLSNSTQKI
jgi:4-hydroxybenzoate polyprenyltransferase